jgi:hypothetical protein
MFKDNIFETWLGLTKKEKNAYSKSIFGNNYNNVLE